MPQTQTKPKEPSKPLSTRKAIVLSIVAVLCLIVCNTALWFSRNIFDTNQFTTTATNSILSPSSRAAIASGITDKVLQNRPAIKSVIDDKATKLISSVLDTSQVRTITEKTVTLLQTAVTSKDPQPIAIDLTGIKSTLSRVATAAEQITDVPTEDRRVNPNDIPDQLVLFDPSNLPNIYVYGTLLLWLGPLLLVVAAGILGYMIYRSYRDKVRLTQILAIESVALLFGGIAALLIGPLMRPPLLAQVAKPNGRIVVGNLFDAFLAPFNHQILAFFILALVLGLTAAWIYISKVRNVSLATLGVSKAKPAATTTKPAKKPTTAKKRSTKPKSSK